MRSAESFCPGHVSCVFQPFSSLNHLAAGSRGLGIRISLGTRVSVTPDGGGQVTVYIDGEPSDASVTRAVVDLLAPGKGFVIRAENDLPVSQGFGTSASGALATALCIASLEGISRQRALEVAHIADVVGGGGLGDVSAIVAGKHVPIRTVPGLPPYGHVDNAGFKIDNLTLGVVGPKLNTGSVLSDPGLTSVIRAAGSEAMDLFMENPTLERMFEASNMFSEKTGLESPQVHHATEKMRSRGYRAAMCMLGNSFFTDAPVDVVRNALGRPNVRAYPCSSYGRELTVTRRG